ncbi:unnamed protein product [Echinostoma caproni]|uniref:DEAD domain-containing protein n=1 Tax=Echinostoma caproni TaxID=27848 RepID=A0A183ACB6_9TREM|nr:unnamed protein product [Echinostoma caproni]
MKRTHPERRKVATRSTVRRVRKASSPPGMDASNELNSISPQASKRTADSVASRRTRERLFSTPVKNSPVKEEDKDSFLSTDSARSGFDFTPSTTGSGKNFSIFTQLRKLFNDEKQIRIIKQTSSIQMSV